MSNKCYYAPQYINQNNVLWWDKEEIRFVAAPLLLFGLFFTYPTIGIILSMVVTFIMARLRRGKPDGYVKHLQYFALPYNPHPTGILAKIFRSKSFPNSAIRHVTG